jgi:hypothetical protein
MLSSSHFVFLRSIFTLPCPLCFLKLKVRQKLTTSNISMYDFIPSSYARAKTICSSVFDSPNIIKGNMLNCEPHLSLVSSSARLLLYALMALLKSRFMSRSDKKFLILVCWYHRCNFVSTTGRKRGGGVGWNLNIGVRNSYASLLRPIKCRFSFFCF